MQNFILTRILKLIAGSLNGYKTKIGGAGLILYGLTGIVGNIVKDQGLPVMDIGTAIGYISAGFVALGIGGKLDKNTAAVKAATTPCDPPSGIETKKPAP